MDELQEIERLYAALLQRGSSRRVSAQHCGHRGEDLARILSERRADVLVPHLKRAMRIMAALQAAHALKASCAQAIRRVPFGVVFLSFAGETIEASAAAQALFEARDGMFCTGGRLHALLHEDDERLQGAIRRILGQASAKSDGGARLTIRRHGGKRALSVGISPIRSQTPLIETPPACMLIIFDAERHAGPAVANIMRTLRLTQAEARLTSQLFSGATLRAAATRLGLSVNTCKSQLKSVYAKTGCRSHVDLAKTLMLAILCDEAVSPGSAFSERRRNPRGRRRRP